MSSTAFLNARLVGHLSNQTYTVTIDSTSGLVSSINPTNSKEGATCDSSTTYDLQGSAFTSGLVSSINPTNSKEGATCDSSFTYDLQGSAFLAPSLVDHHVHFSMWTLASRRLDLMDCTSASQVLTRAREWLALPHDEPFLVGQRMSVGEWKDLDAMNRTSLDALDSRPLVLFFAGFHSLVANSAALEKLGHDPEGHSGILLEGECFAASVSIGELPDDLLDRLMEEAAQAAAKIGVTEIVDLDMAHNIPSWTRRVQKGATSLRIRCGMYDPHLSDATTLGLRSGDVVPNTRGLVTVGPYKIITDGSLGSQTACCHHAYPNDPTNFGLFAYEVPTLREMLKKAIDGGFQLAVHAIGDKANALTLATLAFLPSPPLPGSTIEHAQLLDFADIPLFKKLGLVASVQPVHMIDDKELCDQFWPGRTERSFPFHSLVEAGVELRLGSDAPVAPLDPWDALAVAISRTSAGNEDQPGWHPEQCISNEVAWVASTSNGRVGLAVGDRADLVVLDRDPLVADARQLRAIEVKGTMLGGRWTHFAL